MKLDGANGVGADKMRRLMECFAAASSEKALAVDVWDNGSVGVLNYKVKGSQGRRLKSSTQGLGCMYHKVKGNQGINLCCVAVWS